MIHPLWLRGLTEIRVLPFAGVAALLADMVKFKYEQRQYHRSLHLLPSTVDIF